SPLGEAELIILLLLLAVDFSMMICMRAGLGAGMCVGCGARGEVKVKVILHGLLLALVRHCLTATVVAGTIHGLNGCGLGLGLGLRLGLQRRRCRNGHGIEQRVPIAVVTVTILHLLLNLLIILRLVLRSDRTSG